MAFKRSFNNGIGGEDGAGNEKWATKGYLNLYFPLKDGSQLKVGAIALNDGDATRAKLRKWLEEDEGNLKKFMNKVGATYNPSTRGVERELDLA